MESPQLVCGMTRPLPPHDLYAHRELQNSQATDESSLIDLSSMHGNIDPLLDGRCPATTPAALIDGAWGHHPQQQQVQRFLDDLDTKVFFNAPLVQSPLLNQQSQQHLPVHQQTARGHHSRPRWGSPVSSQELGSSCSSALSPPGGSELFCHENGPATPPAGVDFTTVAPTNSHPHYKHQPPQAGGHTPPFDFWGSPPPLAGGPEYITSSVADMSGYVNPLELGPECHIDFDEFHGGSGGLPTGYYSEQPPPRAFTLRSNSSTVYDGEFSAAIVNTPPPPPFPEALPARTRAASQTFRPLSPLNQEFDSEAEQATEIKLEAAGNDDEAGGFDLPRAPRSSSNRSTALSSKRKQIHPSTPTSRVVGEKPPSPKRQKRQKSNQTEVALTTPILSSITPTAAASSSGSSSSSIMLSQQQPTGRVGHISCPDCRQSTSYKNQAALEAHIKKQHKRPFVCVFAFAGCESTFASKNEWKRHVVSQHILLHYWVCTQDVCAKTVNSPSVLAQAQAPGGSGGDGDPTTAAAPPQRTSGNSTLRGRNSPAISPASSLSAATVHHHHHHFGPRLPNGAIFNRKDLYTQHVRRMHTPPKIKKQQKMATSSPVSTSPPSSKRRQPSSSSQAAAAAAENDELAGWDQHVKRLQRGAEKERCRLPTRMSCPAPGCPSVFEGSNAWDERMEHLAKHLEAAARGEEPAVLLAGAGGGPAEGGAPAVVDRSLIEWASSQDVAIIVPCGDSSNSSSSSMGDNRRQQRWVLNNPLKPSGAAVMAAAAAAAVSAPTSSPFSQQQHQQQPAVAAEIVLGEIVVESGEEDAEGDEEDAEGDEEYDE